MTRRPTAASDHWDALAMLLRVMAHYADRAAHGRDLTARIRGEHTFRTLAIELRQLLRAVAVDDCLRCR